MPKAVPASGGAGDPLGGLLGGGQGLDLAGLVGVGSDEKAAIDLFAAKKKEEQPREAQELARQQQVRGQQMQALKQVVAKQGNRATPEQEAAYKELLRRDKATKDAANALRDNMKRDEEG